MSIFTSVQNRKVNSNNFDLSHDRKLSLAMGKLIPSLVMECVPGDKISLSTSQLLRMAPMIAPVMHQVTCYMHYFFVPNRLTWPDWEDFITGGPDGTLEPVFPFINIGELGVAESSLADYLGLPLIEPYAGNHSVSALPFAAYQMIFNEYYRDQNIRPNKVTWQLQNGDNSSFPQLMELRDRAWPHDYFTSALPWTQRGPEATIPLGSEATVAYDNDGTSSRIRVPNSGLYYDGDAPLGTNPAQPAGALFTDFDNNNRFGVQVDNSAHLRVDLSAASAASINDLRQAFRLQEFLERNARGGSRYIENIMSHFGVKSSDARLQRPEYLGGGSSPITISEVLQTSGTDSEPTPQGNMAGHGISVGASNGFKYFCEEHGYVIGIMSVLPRTAYFQGVPKHFRKFDKFDFYWPSFAHLGEQPIYNYELYLDFTDGENGDVFGYTPRYAEYKNMLSSVHGAFRSTLDFWHMARKFEDRPRLNTGFIESEPTDRIFAVADTPEQLYAHVFHNLRAIRKMPYFGTPTL